MLDGILDTPTAAENRALTVVPVEFWTEHEKRGESFVPFDYVKWAKRGDQSTSVVDKVARLSKTNADGAPSRDPVWMALKPAYEAWKAGQEPPVDGTPLEAWAGLSPSQAKAMKAAGFKAVEHIAAMTEQDLHKVRLPDARRLRDMAKAFVLNKERDAPIEAALAERDAKLEAQAAEIAEMRAALERIAAAEKPKRRGQQQDEDA